MFTGIIEEIGKIESVVGMNDGKRLKIFCRKVLEKLKVGDSVCVNGVCLTATQIDNKGFTCEAVGVTLTKTSMAFIGIKDFVNLERALLVSERLGGHFVQGHVNGTGYIKQIKRFGENYVMEISIPDFLCKYVVDEGSIAVDGVSLTVAGIVNNQIGLSIIPHTWNNTTLSKKQIGDLVNLETDIIAKYIENLVVRKDTEDVRFTDSWFKNLGY